MLSLPNDGRYLALNMDPQQRRQKTLEALTTQVEALSRQKPVLMIFEDAHWTDPTSLETFGRVVDKVRTLPVLLIVTFRPEFTRPGLDGPCDRVTLNRLAEGETSVIMSRWSATSRLRQAFGRTSSSAPMAFRCSSRR